MSPERLEAIRERVRVTGGSNAAADRAELLDEVERLRAGIEGIKAKALDHQKIITEGPLVGRILVSHWCDNALTDPTEGEGR